MSEWRTRLLRLLVGVLAVVMVGAATTTASAAEFTYDAPAVACVDVHETNSVEARQAEVSGSREGSALASDESRVVSTTPSAGSVATN